MSSNRCYTCDNIIDSGSLFAADGTGPYCTKCYDIIHRSDIDGGVHIYKPKDEEPRTATSRISQILESRKRERKHIGGPEYTPPPAMPATYSGPPIEVPVRHKPLTSLEAGFHSLSYEKIPHIIETKIDGIYVEISSPDGEHVIVLSKSGNRKESIESELGSLGKFLGNKILKGEAEFQSQDAVEKALQRGYPIIWIFDIEEPGKKPSIISRKEAVTEFILSIPNDGRYKLSALPYIIVPEISPDIAMFYMKKHVDIGDEGICIKGPLDSEFEYESWYKRKYEVTMDYVVTDFEISSSWQGIDSPHKIIKSIEGGLYIEGPSGLKLTPVVNVGSMTLDERLKISANKEGYIGKVFEVKGFKVFKSGSMRHPSFLRWRPDKSPEDCTLRQVPKIIL